MNVNFKLWLHWHSYNVRSSHVKWLALLTHRNSSEFIRIHPPWWWGPLNREYVVPIRPGCDSTNTINYYTMLYVTAGLVRGYFIVMGRVCLYAVRIFMKTLYFFWFSRRFYLFGISILNALSFIKLFIWDVPLPYYL